MKETKTILGRNGLGRMRRYTFRILDTIHGLQLIEQYKALLGEQIPLAMDLFKGCFETNEEKVQEPSLVRIAQALENEVIAEVLTPLRLAELKNLLLQDAEIDGVSCDRVFSSNDQELYIALLYAVVANFQDYLPFGGPQRYDGRPLNDKEDPRRDLVYPEHIAIGMPEIQITSVARYYHLDPLQVEKWTITGFAKYQEAMLLNREIERQQYAHMNSKETNHGGQRQDIPRFVRRRSSSTEPTETQKGDH